ncbi:MAG: LysR family transcriptional regulator [Pseudomonadota bacterium]
MDIKDLYTFVAIAEHGSFLAASRALGLSPAAVSLHVKTIEDSLGEILFDRSVRPPVLTDAGRRALLRARRALEAWEELSARQPPDVSGILEIGAVPTAIAGLLADGLAQMRRTSPQLKVHLSTGYSDELAERVTRGTLDAAVMMPPVTVPLGLAFDEVVVEPFHVVAAASAKGRTDLDLLRSQPYIRFRRQAWISRLIEGELERRKIRLEAAMEIDTLSGVLALVEAGLGVSILPLGQIGVHHATAIRAIPFGNPPATRTLGLLHRPDHPRAPQLLELKAALAAIVSTTRASNDADPEPVQEPHGDGKTQQKQQVDANDDRP